MFLFCCAKNIRPNYTHYFSMKIHNKQELQQIAFNYSSEIDFRDFMSLYKKWTAKPYSFSVIDGILASDNPLRFRKNLLERRLKLIIAIDDKIRDEKLQYDINREAAKISALSSGQIDKYEYLTGEEILRSDERQIIEQVKSTYSPLGKAFVRQTKTSEEQGRKEINAITNQNERRTALTNHKDDYREIVKEILE